MVIPIIDYSPLWVTMKKKNIFQYRLLSWLHAKWCYSIPRTTYLRNLIAPAQFIFVDGAILSLPNAYPALKQAKQNSEHSANLKYSLEFCFLRFDVIKLLTTIIVMWYITTRREQECIHEYYAKEVFVQISTKFTIAVHLLTAVAYFSESQKVTSDFLAGSIEVTRWSSVILWDS